MESQIGKLYFVRCGDNPNYFKTVRVVRNLMTGNLMTQMTGNLQTQMSNPVYGEPPDGVPEMPPLMRQRLQSCNNAMPYTS